MLIARYPDALPLAADVGLDARVLAVAMLVTLATSLIASLPRLRALGRTSVAGDLAEGARGLVGPHLARNTFHFPLTCSIARV